MKSKVMNVRKLLAALVLTVPLAGLLLLFQNFSFTNAGSMDLIWQNRLDGTVAFWSLNGIELQSGQLFPNTAPGMGPWRLVGTADFNGDGQPDFVWQNDQDHSIAYWLMSGTKVLNAGYFPGGAPNVSAGLATWRLVAVADLNNDGYPDMLWQNTADFSVAYWLMNGFDAKAGAHFPDGTPAVSVGGLRDWRLVGAGDFNGDGVKDLVWQNRTTWAVAYWFMNLSQRSIAQGIFPNTASGLSGWTLTGISDVGLDGRPDFIWQYQSGVSGFWRMNGINLIEGSMFPQAAGPGLENWRLVSAVNSVDPASSIPVDIQKMAFDAGSLQMRIQTEPSLGVRRALREEKSLIDHWIGSKMRLQSCRELLNVDRTLTSGVYQVYVNGDERAAKSVYCQISDGKLVKEINAVDITNGVVAAPPLEPEFCPAQTITWGGYGGTCTATTPYLTDGQSTAVSGSNGKLAGIRGVACVGGELVQAGGECGPTSEVISVDYAGACGNGFCACHESGQPNTCSQASADVICAQRGYARAAAVTCAAGPVGQIECNSSGACFQNANPGNTICSTVTCTN